MTEQSRPGMGSPAMAPQQAARPGLFGGGFGAGLLGGIIGVGLGGMLFGHGMFGGGGFGGMASFLGLMLQLALVAGLVWLVVGFFRRRQASPAFAGMPNAMAREATPGPAFGGGGGGAPASAPVQIVEADFVAFEQNLQQVNAAYSAQNLGAMRALATPERKPMMRTMTPAASNPRVT